MKRLLREVNELGKRLERGGKDLVLMDAGSHLAAVGTGQEELSAHQHRLQEVLSGFRLKAVLSFTEWGSCRACRTGTAVAHTLLWQEGTSPSTNQCGLLFSVLTALPCSLFCVQWTSLTRVLHVCFPALASFIFLLLQCLNLFCLSCKFINITLFKSGFISIWIVFKLCAVKCPFSLSCRHTENTPYRLKHLQEQKSWKNKQGCWRTY